MYKALTKANKKLQRQRINQTVWTKGDILAFAKMLNSIRWSSKERQNDILELWGDMKDEYQITKEQSNFGIKWLNEVLFKKDGTNRNNKMTQDFREKDFDIVRNFKEFKFVGYDEAVNGFNSHYSPIYRCIDVNGNYFDYVARMWQAPEIVGRGKEKLPLELALTEAI
jgi:hypothetical protein